MKIKATIFSLLIISILLSSCGPSHDDALEYGELIVGHVDSFIISSSVLFDDLDSCQKIYFNADNKVNDSIKISFDEKDLKRIKEEYDDLLLIASNKIADIEQMEDINFKINIKQSALDYINGHFAVFTNEFRTYLNYIENYIGDEELDEIINLLDIAYNKLQASANGYKEEMNSFCRIYEIQEIY